MGNSTTLLLLCLCSYCLSAQHALPLKVASAKEIDRSIPALMASADIPGLSIAIVDKGSVVYQKAFGYRSMDTREPVTGNTIFSAASLSKALFAYGLMKWVENGRFDLDRPLENYLPYEDLAHDDRYKKLTARQVLSHTTGLPNWRQGEQLDFLRDPGEKFEYSGEAFVYLMKVVEHLSNLPIDDFMQQMVFGPLGMTRSSYVWQERFEEDHAIPHDQFLITNPVRKPTQGNTAYSLQTTAADYILFIKALLNGEELNQKTIDQMLSPQAMVMDGQEKVQWGLGVGLQTTAAGKNFWHWGDNGTFKAFFIGFPEQKIGLVFFANSSNGLGITEDLLLSCMGGSSYPALRWLDYEGPKAPARKLLNHILKTDNDFSDWPFLDKNGLHQDTLKIAEAPMNRLGYNLLSLNRPREAIRVFRMNSMAYPASSEVFDNYGKALLRNGQLEEAAVAYSRAAELDTANTVAQAIVYQIRQGNKNGNTTFVLNSYPYARSVQLAGSFNDWNALKCPMIRENGKWMARVDLEPGSYEYKFIVDGVWILDPANPKSVYEDHHNSVLVKE